MTYSISPDHYYASRAGMSLDDYADMQEAAERAQEDGTYDREVMALDPERFVSEADYYAPTAQDWADLQWVLDCDQWEGMGR